MEVANAIPKQRSKEITSDFAISADLMAKNVGCASSFILSWKSGAIDLTISTSAMDGLETGEG